MPRSRSVETFACVAGCSHIWLSIAGATTIGAVVASAVSATMSLAPPWASRARQSAVAGAITSASQRRAISTCASASAAANMSVTTSRPVSD